jgi:hypothetical protein
LAGDGQTQREEGLCKKGEVGVEYLSVKEFRPGIEDFDAHGKERLRAFGLGGKDLARLALDPDRDRAAAHAAVLDVRVVTLAGIHHGNKDFTTPGTVDGEFLEQVHGMSVRRAL